MRIFPITCCRTCLLLVQVGWCCNSTCSWGCLVWAWCLQAPHRRSSSCGRETQVLPSPVISDIGYKISVISTPLIYYCSPSKLQVIKLPGGDWWASAQCSFLIFTGEIESSVSYCYQPTGIKWALHFPLPWLCEIEYSGKYWWDKY